MRANVRIKNVWRKKERSRARGKYCISHYNLTGRVVTCLRVNRTCVCVCVRARYLQRNRLQKQHENIVHARAARPSTWVRRVRAHLCPSA